MSTFYKWTRKTLRSDLWIAGKTISTGGADLSWREAGETTALLRMLAGNTVYQRRIGDRFAPMALAPWAEVQLELQAIDEADADYLQEVREQHLPMFFELQCTDRYYLISEAHTAWVLSRPLPWLIGTDADYPVVVKVSDEEDRATFDALTLAASSPPGAGEFYYAGTAGEQSIETADLSAEAGRILSVTYSPIRRMIVEEIDSQSSGGDRHGAIDVTLRLSEHLPSQVW